MTSHRIEHHPVRVARLGALNVFRFAMRTSKDPIARYRVIWFTVAFTISFTLTAIGAGFAFAGAHATVAPQVYKFVAIFPGRLRTHGWVLFLLGISNFWSVAALTQIYSKTAYTIGRLSGIGILFYSVFTAIGFLAGITTGGVGYNAGVWWYLMIAVLSVAKVALPPPFRGQPDSDRPNLITGA